MTDRPLPALAPRKYGLLRGRPPAEAQAENMRQLIQLRWFAVAGQLLAILVAHFGLGVPLPLASMLAIVGALAAANLLFTASLRRPGQLKNRLLPALLLDMAALTAQLYLSGGATNPFVSLYLLQVVLGAILLPAGSVWLLVATSSLCFAFLNFTHLPLILPERLWDVSTDLLLAGEWVSYVLVAVLLVLFIGRIARNLRAQDAYLAELAQRTAEEDGIVRMGLFASGAAHELGTPLSTLSVLLADWQRHPAVAGTPELSEEVAEAQGELRRCKEIVSNILHSAGLARGEAMGSIDLAPLLADIAEDWRALHDGVQLDGGGEGVGNVRVAAEPALRQAIWNLLENAVEAGASRIELGSEVVGDRVAVSVADNGSGFPPGQTDSLGRLYQSSKGAGHGLGLFLASNVARRLGGTLEAFNRDGGGAAVRMLLPLASGGGSSDDARQEADRRR